MDIPWDPKRVPSPARLNERSYYSNRRRKKPDERKLRRGKPKPSDEMMNLKQEEPLSEWAYLGDKNRQQASKRLAAIAGRGEHRIVARSFEVKGELGYPSDSVWFIQLNDEHDSNERKWKGCVGILSGLQARCHADEYLRLVDHMLSGDYTRFDMDAAIMDSLAQDGQYVRLGLEGGDGEWKVIMETMGSPFVIHRSSRGTASRDYGLFSLSLCGLLLTMRGFRVSTDGKTDFDPIRHFEMMSNLVAR